MIVREFHINGCVLLPVWEYVSMYPEINDYAYPSIFSSFVCSVDLVCKYLNACLGDMNR
jgi:hypothetical protein